MKKIFSLIIILGLSLLPVTLFAASSSPTIPIAVLDFTLHDSVATLDGDTQKVNGTLEVFETHTTPTQFGSLDLLKIRTTSNPSLNNVTINLSVHGTSSRMQPKKSYNLNFEQATKFLSMPEEKEWVLHSCWGDKTCLRNVIGYWQAFQIFPWAPRTEFVEVFINNEYRGLYVVVEKIKVGPSRLNLAQPNDADNITGTYILKQERFGVVADQDWTTSSGVPWWLVSPKHPTNLQLSYIKKEMEDFSPSYQGAMNEKSVADFIIIQEMANNPDAYYRSMYVTKYPSSSVNTRPPNNYPNDDLLHMGPIWDLDAGFANYNREKEFCSTNTWRINLRPGDAFQPLQLLWKESRFRQAISNRWLALRDDRGRHDPAYSTIASKRIEDKIDLFAARIGSARLRDNVKWPTLGTHNWNACWDPPTYQKEIDMLKSWVRARIDWMDKAFSDPGFINP